MSAIDGLLPKYHNQCSVLQYQPPSQENLFSIKVTLEKECERTTPCATSRHIDFDFTYESYKVVYCREIQVLSMISAGKAVKEIAGELHLSASTIRTFRASILKKIGTEGTTELIHYAITHNLTEQ